jgi:hypothetical protein
MRRYSSVAVADTGDIDCRQWLDAHPGKGDWDGGADGDDEADERAQLIAARAQQALAAMAPTLGTPAETYLAGRGIRVSAQAAGYHADAYPRRGLGALVGVLKDSAKLEDVLGVALTFVDPAGRPELRADGKKVKQVWFVVPREDQARRRAVFRIPARPAQPAAGAAPEQTARAGTTPKSKTQKRPAAPSNGVRAEKTSLAGARIVAEGLENALVISMAAPETEVFGVPGIGRIGGCSVTGDIIYMRDNDGASEQAKKPLAAAVDGLVLGNPDGTVRVTDTPLNYDAADYAKDGKIAELRRLLIDAMPAELSRDGEIERLAKIYVEDRLSFGAAAAAVAKKFNIKPPSALQKAVEARIKFDPPEAAQKTVTSDIGPDDMSADPVSAADIVEVCNTAARQMRKYVHTHKLDLATATIWSLFTHFLQHETIYVGKNPRLIPSSLGADCGKTTALNCLALLVPRAYTTGDTSGPMLVWVANKYHPTALYDELDKHLRNKEGGLYPIFLYGYSRKFARKGKMEKDGDDNYTGVTMDAWLALAGTSVGILPDDQLNARCIYWHLFAATPEELSALHVLDEDDFCSVLDECRRKFARWAHDLKELPEVRKTKWEPKELRGKARLNWSMLMRVAAAVGGHWPSTIMKAARRAQERAPEPHDWILDFLRDVRTIMVEMGVDRIWSETLAEKLPALDNASRNWERLNLNRQAVSEMLSRILRHHCDPPMTTKSIRIGDDVKRGVLWRQLQDLFDRHLPPLVPEKGEDEGIDLADRPGASAGASGGVSRTESDKETSSAATPATAATPLKTSQKSAETPPLHAATNATKLRARNDVDHQTTLNERNDVASVAAGSGSRNRVRNEKAPIRTASFENVAAVAGVAGPDARSAKNTASTPPGEEAW